MLSRYFDVKHWPFYAAPLKVERALNNLRKYLYIYAFSRCLKATYDKSDMKK